MTRRDFESPTVQEILNAENSDELIKTHVKAYDCECGNRQLVTTADGWNCHYECDECGKEFTYVG